MILAKIRRLIWISVLMALFGVRCGNDTCTQPKDSEPPIVGRRIDFGAKWCPADTARIGYTHTAKDWKELWELGQESIWIVDIVTGEEKHITEGTLLDWSPDGRQILLGRKGEPATFRDLTTGQETTLPIYSGPIDVSPSGEEIAYVCWEEPIGIYIMDLATVETEWIARRYYCDWSPEGQRILCDHLLVIARDGTPLQEIPVGPGPGIASQGRWSPDGTRIAFGGYCDEGRRDPGVWVVNTDGTELRRIACRGAQPSWSPDGKSVAYTARSSGEYISAIWITSVDGNEVRQITFP
jgi:dipeptidyl aminopeptidase/acylaminoacyl peptidase